MRITATSDVGKIRANNEDTYICGELDGAVYAAVCDGMGGVNGGEIASDIAAKTICAQIETAFSPKMHGGAIERMLVSAITAANVKVYDYALKNGMVGMGTTAVLALLKDNCLYVAHVGDSRAYLIGKEIRQLTTDHTFLNEMYRLGQMSLEQIQNDPRKNIITRAIGVSEEVEADVLCEDIEPGDLILLCSDGLTNCLSDEEIRDICLKQAFEDVAKVLIDTANEHGGVDNITAALIENAEG